MRGSGTSAGTFTLFENERRDGADALAWAATLEGGNGRLGMYGFSYQAATQLLALAGALDDGGPTPAALCPTMMGWDVHADWAYECDAFCLAGDVEAFTALRASARVLPLNEEGTAWPTVLERYARYTHYADWLGDALPALANRTIDVPMLHVGGWYGPMLEGTLAAFQAMAGSRAPQRLVVGPWGPHPVGPPYGHRRLRTRSVEPDRRRATALVRSPSEGP